MSMLRIERERDEKSVCWCLCVVRKRECVLKKEGCESVCVCVCVLCRSVG